MSYVFVHRRRRPLPPDSRGANEPEHRFVERMRRREQLLAAEVSEEVDDDGRVWVVRHLPPPDPHDGDPQSLPDE